MNGVAGPATERRYRVHHRTGYRYDLDMVDGYTVAHLLVRPTRWQQVLTTQVSVDPEPAEFDEFSDLFGNRVVQFGVHRPHRHLIVDAVSVVVLSRPDPLDDGPPWEQVAEQTAALRGPDALDVGSFRGRSQFVDLEGVGTALYELGADAFRPGRSVVDAARSLCHQIFVGFEFDPTATDVSTPLDQVLDARRGVCQDFAHLAIGCLRARGLAARYVSGYLETEPPPGLPRLVGADTSHAWCSLWVPEAGWVDFDPTNDHLPVTRHVTVGWGRDFADVSPVRGVVIGPASTQTLEVSVDVTAV